MNKSQYSRKVVGVLHKKSKIFSPLTPCLCPLQAGASVSIGHLCVSSEPERPLSSPTGGHMDPLPGNTNPERDQDSGEVRSLEVNVLSLYCKTTRPCTFSLLKHSIFPDGPRKLPLKEEE